MELGQVPQTRKKILQSKFIYISNFFISKMKMGPGINVEAVSIMLKVVPNGFGL